VSDPLSEVKISKANAGLIVELSERNWEFLQLQFAFELGGDRRLYVPIAKRHRAGYRARR
jgi:hypothetical protein